MINERSVHRRFPRGVQPVGDWQCQRSFAIEDGAGQQSGFRDVSFAICSRERALCENKADGPERDAG
jgi:hypothetical protein